MQGWQSRRNHVRSVRPGRRRRDGPGCRRWRPWTAGLPPLRAPAGPGSTHLDAEDARMSAVSPALRTLPSTGCGWDLRCAGNDSQTIPSLSESSRATSPRRSFGPPRATPTSTPAGCIRTTATKSRSSTTSTSASLRPPPRGLLVPNIKDAQNLGLKELAIALRDLAATARDGRRNRRICRAEPSRSLTSAPWASILGRQSTTPARSRSSPSAPSGKNPWVVSGNVIPRWITTLGVSFDHRVIDGDLSAKFMAYVAAIIEEPARLLA